MNHLITKAENTGLKSCDKKGFTVQKIESGITKKFKKRKITF